MVPTPGLLPVVEQRVLQPPLAQVPQHEVLLRLEPEPPQVSAPRWRVPPTYPRASRG